MILANKATHIVRFKRRRQGRTNYKKRRTMLLSGKDRFVVRKSNKNIICQIITSKEGQDKVIVQVNSTELKKYGWKNNTGNIPSAYLTGYLCAKKSKKKNAVLDMGLQTSTKGSRIYAALKGAIDGGINIPYDDKVIPSENRIKGEHINKEMEKHWGEVKSKIEKETKA